MKQLLFSVDFTLVPTEWLECTIRSEKQVMNCNWVKLNHGSWRSIPIGSEVMEMILNMDAKMLQCAYGIMELDIAESKKSYQELF